MVNTIPLARSLKPQSVKQITLISLVALLLGHLMINTYIPSVAINFIGLIIVSFYINQKTLHKNDVFSFLMVIYFCSTFPYLSAKGGGFNMVSFVCILLYFILKKKIPAEKSNKDIWFKIFVVLFILSSILGWIFNYTGKGLDFVYSFITFFGIILLLLVSSRIVLTYERIKVFLQLNFVLIILSTIASLNKYLHIITFKTPMMPIYGAEGSYFEGGGLIGSSPLYGEHSLILLMLFAVFLILGNKTLIIKQKILLAGVIIAYINVFMSISRSVFLLSIVGLVLIILVQFKMVQINVTRIIHQIVIVLSIAFIVFYFVNATGLNYVFDRMERIEELNYDAGGITIDRILDGSAFNRGLAFEIATERYKSKESWIIGYGWGVGNNNRDAFYVNPTILRGSAHSQIFAILFIFGWIGFIAYWGLIFRIIIKSYKIMGYKNIDFIYKIMACFFMISFILFFLNEIKADSISYPSYFAVTIIWMGLAYSTFNSTVQKNFASK